MASLSQVVDQMQAHGLPMLPANHPVLDGKVHRFGPKKKAWYLLREVQTRSGAQLIGGAFGIWQGTNNNSVPVAIDWKGISAEERAAAEQKQREFDEAERQKRQALADAAANRARQQWESAAVDDGLMYPESPYLQRKQVALETARVAQDGTLLVPMRKYSREGTRLAGLQKIAPDGGKFFNKGMDKVGAACLLGQLRDDSPVVIVAEGYATAGSIRLALEQSLPVMVAFDAGNLLPVAQGIRRDFPGAHILFAADDDYQLVQRLNERLQEDFKVEGPITIDGVERTLTAENGELVQVTATWRHDANGVQYIEADVRGGRQVRTLKFENAGIARATAAAKSVGNASVIYPAFIQRGDNKWTDFNDLHVQQSLDAVKEQIATAIDAAIMKPATPALSLVKNSPPPTVSEAVPAVEAGGAAPDSGEGDSKKKPKRVYPESHWDTVNFLLRNFVLIYGTDDAWDEQQRMIIKIAHLRLAYTSDAVKFWLNNSSRRMVLKDRVVFDPTERCDPETHVNLYHGFEMRPKPGSCERIKELLCHLCDNNAEVLAWVLRWIAYPLRHKGAKMRTSIIIHGDEGSGKNLFWENVVRRIYGEYGGVIGNAQIESQFNEWASKKLFFVADEVVTRSELRQLKGKLKHMVTGETIMINPKGMTERSEANHMNFVFLSNELQPLVLDKTDRRYLVLWTPPNKPPEFYKAVADEIDNGGVEAFFDYLMSVPLGDFNEHTKPLMTEAKTKLIGLGLTPPEKFYREWSGGFLPLPFVCCSAMQLYLGFCRWCHLNGERFPMTQTMFGRTIDRVGFGEVRRGIIKCDIGNDVKQRTCYLVGDQPQDKTRAKWVEDASAVFETALKKYRHVYDQQVE